MVCSSVNLWLHESRSCSGMDGDLDVLECCLPAFVFAQISLSTSLAGRSTGSSRHLKHFSLCDFAPDSQIGKRSYLSADLESFAHQGSITLSWLLPVLRIPNGLSIEFFRQRL